MGCVFSSRAITCFDDNLSASEVQQLGAGLFSVAASRVEASAITKAKRNIMFLPLWVDTERTENVAGGIEGVPFAGHLLVNAQMVQVGPSAKMSGFSR